MNIIKEGIMMKNGKNVRFGCGMVAGFAGMLLLGGLAFAADEAKIGVNYPETGPYAKEGADQKRAAELAAAEINAAGGILGKQIALVFKDDKNSAKVTKENVTDLFDNEGVSMVFGGSSSGVAIAAGKVAKAKKKLFFGTLTYSTETTGEEGHKYIFRECNDSGMSARVLSSYIKKNLTGKKFFYITADYTWGWTTEEMIRKYSDTVNKDSNKGILTKLGSTDFKKVLEIARDENPQVLVLVLFGKDMEIAIKQAYDMGLKDKMQIIVPNLTDDMADGAGVEAMEGVIGTVPWSWKIAMDKGFKRGQEFVKNYEAKYNRYPTCSGGSAYTILYEYKAAVEAAGTFDTMPVIKALENHSYTSLKDEQTWRAFDHQSVQTVYAVKGKKAADVKKDKHQFDFFEIIGEMKGSDATISLSDWTDIRTKVGASTTLAE